MSKGLQTAVGSICLQCDNKASDYCTMSTVRKRDDLQLMLGDERLLSILLSIFTASLARPLAPRMVFALEVTLVRSVLVMARAPHSSGKPRSLNRTTRALW